MVVVTEHCGVDVSKQQMPNRALSELVFSFLLALLQAHSNHCRIATTSKLIRSWYNRNDHSMKH